MLCVYTKNIYFKFQAVFSLNCMCASFAPFLYICRNLIYIFCIFIINKILIILKFWDLCIQNIYKFSVLYNFCVHFVWFLYKFFGKGHHQWGQDL